MSIQTERSLFDRLFRYRQREGRAPMEDFLSELVVYLLAHLPMDKAIVIIERCFIPEDLKTCFLESFSDKILTITSQKRIDKHGVLDILIEANGLPVVVIENKIGARFQHRIDESIDGNESEEKIVPKEQLKKYCQWLDFVKKSEGWVGVVALLTHTSIPPHGFGGGLSAGFDTFTHVCTWKNFYRELLNLVGDGLYTPSTPAWNLIGRELCRFLENNDMATYELNKSDVETVALSIAAIRKYPPSFKEIHTHFQNYRDRTFFVSGNSCSIEANDGLISGWLYFAQEDKIWLGYGIFFPPAVGQMSDAEPPLPSEAHAFIAVGSDKVATKQTSLPDGWSKCAGGWRLMKPISFTNRKANEFFSEFIIREIMKELDVIQNLTIGFRETI